jgi:hypothetical protein
MYQHLISYLPGSIPVKSSKHTTFVLKSLPLEYNKITIDIHHIRVIWHLYIPKKNFTFSLFIIILYCHLDICVSI